MHDLITNQRMTSVPTHRIERRGEVSSTDSRERSDESAAEPVASEQSLLVHERPGPGPTGPIGFVSEPSSEHINRAVSAIEHLAHEASPRTGAKETLSVSLSHFRWDPMLARSLFGFSVYDFTHEGKWIYPFDSGQRIQYAIALNQSIELQKEVALTFLHQLVFRQVKFRDMSESNEPVFEIDKRMAREDERARAEIGDRLRFGWSAVMETVVLRAQEAGFNLDVSYEPNLISTRDQLVRRIPFLRRLYNELPPIRDCVDKLISMAGGDDPRLAAGMGSSEIRDWFQQQTRVWGLRHYQNQALRDAEVCGNGYLAFSIEEPVGPFNLRPESVIVEEDGTIAVDPPDQSVASFDADSVVHIRGSQQIASPYGVSILEPFLPVLRTMDVYSAAASTAQAIQETKSTEHAKAWAAATMADFERIRKASIEKVREMLWFPLNHLPDPVGELYFEGHERI